MFASEIDKFARQAYGVLYDDSVLHGDITKIDADEVPDHDVLVGGFPCQAFSIAGKRGGFEDSRGTLFFEVARIASQKQPSVLLLENVKGLVGHDGGSTLNTIVTTLNECGYAVDFEVLNSKYFGVPQNRERIFIVGVLNGAHEEWRDVTDRTRKDVVAKGKRRIAQLDGVRTFNFDWPEQEAVTTRLRDVLESDVDERYYLSEEKTAKLVAQLNGETIGSDEGIEWHGDLKTQEAVYPRNYLDVYGVMGDNGVSQCLRTMQGGNREPKIAEVKPLGNREPKIAGLSEGDCLQRSQSGVHRKEIYGTLRAGASRTDFGVVDNNYSRSYRIRKLTPRECWRLQGFTDAQHDAVVAAGVSNSQRYKQAGNAVTVDVIEAVGARLLRYLPSRPASSGASNPAS